MSHLVYWVITPIYRLFLFYVKVSMHLLCHMGFCFFYGGGGWVYWLVCLLACVAVTSVATVSLSTMYILNHIRWACYQGACKCLSFILLFIPIIYFLSSVNRGLHVFGNPSYPDAQLACLYYCFTVEIASSFTFVSLFHMATCL